LPVDVEMVETLGADHLIHGAVDGQPIVVRTTNSLLPESGERIWVHFAPDNMHYFNPLLNTRL